MHACMHASKHAYNLHVIFEGLQNHVWTKGFTAHCCAVRSAKESRGPQKESRGKDRVEDKERRGSEKRVEALKKRVEALRQ